jgi:protein-disulfide isomerase
MLKFFRAAALGAALAVAAIAPAPAQSLNDGQKREIETLIKDYLIKNPEIIQEALMELERRQREAEVAARQKITKDPNGPLLASKHNVVLGNPRGNVTMVEFFDYNCGFCKRGLADLQRLAVEDKNLRIILKDFPILTPGSREAAAVAMAVKKQVRPEKYWEFHVKLMGRSGAIGKNEAFEVAKEVGADLARVEADMVQPEVAEALNESRQLADSLGLTGTPSYVIGDEVVVGAVGFAQLKEKIDNTRKCGKAQC